MVPVDRFAPQRPAERHLVRLRQTGEVPAVLGAGAEDHEGLVELGGDSESVLSEVGVVGEARRGLVAVHRLLDGDEVDRDVVEAGVGDTTCDQLLGVLDAGREVLQRQPELLRCAATSGVHARVGRRTRAPACRQCGESARTRGEPKPCPFVGELQSHRVSSSSVGPSFMPDDGGLDLNVT